MSRWSKAAARLNRAADRTYGETISILRLAVASDWVKSSAEPSLVHQLVGVISEGEAVTGPADGTSAGDRAFQLQLESGALIASFVRTGFASAEQRPKRGDLLRVETGPRTGQTFEVLNPGLDDGDRLNVPLVWRS